MTLPVIESDYTSNDNAGVPSTSLVLTKPAGASTGDLLILMVGNDVANPSNDFDSLTGWTLLFNAGDILSDAALGVYYRVADGTEGSTETVTWTTTAEAYGWYIRVSGVDQTTPINASSTPVETTSTTSHAITGVTTSVDDCVVFYALAFDGGNGAPFTISGTGWSETAEGTSGTAGNDASGVWGQRDLVTAGASGTATVGSNVSDGAIGVQFAIAPAAGGVESGAGSSSGVATVTAVGASTAEAAAAAAGVATASAVGASTHEAVAAAAGAATAAAVGESTAAGAGAASGAATAAAVGASTHEAAAASAGAATAAAVGSSTHEAVAAAAGAATVAAVGDVAGGVSSADGAAAGVATATAIGASRAAADGAAAGIATATAIGSSTAAADGAASGVATAAAAGAGVHSAVGAASGIATALGIGELFFSGVGAAAGAATAAGIGASTFAGAGSSSGTATATATGASTAAAVGSAAGLASVAGVSEAGELIAPAAELQKLILDTAKADAGVAALVAARFYDKAPEGGAFPYARFGPGQAIPGDADCITSAEHFRQIDIFSRQGGAVACGRICHAFKAALHDKDLALTDNRLALIEVDGTRVIEEPDGAGGITFHGIVSIRAIVEEGP